MRRCIWIVLAGLLFAVPLAAQSSIRAPAPNYKDATTGVLFGVLLTGGGQLYAHRYSKGAVLLSIGTMALLSGAAASHGPTCETASGQCVGASYTPLYVGAAVAIGAWLYGIVTAPRDVATYNDDARSTLASRLRPVLDVGRTRGGRVGVSLSFGR